MTNETRIDTSIEHERAKIFLERNAIVHVSKLDGTFFNGRLFTVETDFFEIHDRVIGRQVVFFLELKKPLQEYVVEGGE